MTGDGRLSPRRVAVLLAAPAIWFAHFSVLYGCASFGDALGVAPSDRQALTWGATAVAAAGIVALWLRLRRSAASPATPAALADMGRLLAMLSLVAVVLQVLAIGLVPGSG